MTEIITNSPDETSALGKQIAKDLCVGSIVALQGKLGSGKTNLTKGIAAGLGLTENLTSPTYTIINEYQRESLPIFYHIDAYRLNTNRDFHDIGGLDIINSGGICVIEWSERILESLPDEKIIISIEITGGSSRLITLRGGKW